VIIVLGSINLDQVGNVPRLPKPGETVSGTSFAISPGGKGANQALAARRAGADVVLVGAVGTDVFAGEALSLLKHDGVDLSKVRTVPGATGIAMILVDERGENVIAAIPGANTTVSADDAERAFELARPGDIILLQQEVPQAATRRALALGREHGLVTVLNTAPLLATTVGIAGQASIMVANEAEFLLLTGCERDGIDGAMASWAAQNRQTVIVTLSAEGAKAATGHATLRIPAPRIDPVDTVGAGDTFCGYFASALDKGWTTELALKIAIRAASHACLSSGAQTAMPYAHDLDG
jgi:ribokinase